MTTATIPIGFATRAGITGALSAFVLAVAALATDHSPEAIAATATAAITLLTVLAGRYAQAHALASRPGPLELGSVPTIVEFAGTDDDDEPDVWGSPPPAADTSLNADPADIAGAHDHPAP